MSDEAFVLGAPATSQDGGALRPRTGFAGGKSRPSTSATSLSAADTEARPFTSQTSSQSRSVTSYSAAESEEKKGATRPATALALTDEQHDGTSGGVEAHWSEAGQQDSALAGHKDGAPPRPSTGTSRRSRRSARSGSRPSTAASSALGEGDAPSQRRPSTAGIDGDDDNPTKRAAERRLARYPPPTPPRPPPPQVLRDVGAWRPYGWTVGFQMGEMKDTAFEGDAEAEDFHNPLEEGREGGVVVQEDDSEDEEQQGTALRPNLPPTAPAWMHTAESERLHAKERNKQRELDRQIEERIRLRALNAMRENEHVDDVLKKLRKEDHPAKLCRSLHDGRYEFLAETSEARAAVARGRMVQASLVARRAEERETLLRKELEQLPSIEQAEQDVDDIRRKAQRLERYFMSEFMMNDALERFRQAQREKKEKEATIAKIRSHRKELEVIAATHRQRLRVVEESHQEVVRYCDATKALEAAAPSLVGYGSDVVRMRAGGKEMVCALARLSPAAEKVKKKRPTLDSLLAKCEKAAPTVGSRIRKPPPTERLAGWVWRGGLNRVTKSECWLRRWARLLPTELLMTKEKMTPDMLRGGRGGWGGADGRPVTAPAAPFSGAASDEPDPKDRVELKQCAFITPVGNTGLALVTDDGGTAMLRFASERDRNAWRVAAAYLVDGLRTRTPQ